jgi:uncharacterized membrane protein YdjX (TVP38/TMEM64 family)
MSAAEDKISVGSRWWRTALTLTVVAVALYAYYQSGIWHEPERVRELGYGAHAAVAIVVAMSVAWAFALPASAFLFITPLLFPPATSALVTTCGSALGSSVGYLVARYVGGPWVERFRDGRLSRFLARHSSFLALFGIRLTPSSPHGFINYAAGLARVPYLRFVVATTLAMAVKSYVYAEAVHAAVGAKSLMDALTGKTLLALFAVALLAVLGHVLRERLLRGEGSGGRRRI